MALGSWFWGETTTETSYYNHNFDNNYKIHHFGEKDDSSGGYSYGQSTGWNKKSKSSEKKQAAMSALTLIAFLFFLNILQNCLQEQTEEVPIATVVMMTPAVQAQNRQPDQEPTPQTESSRFRGRKLMSLEVSERESKFIKDFRVSDKDWTNELTQVSEDELRDQKEKMDKLRKLWKSDDSGQIKKFVNNPVLSDLRSGRPKLSNYWGGKLTTEAPETKSVDFEEPKRKNADFHEFEHFREPELFDKENVLVKQAAQHLNVKNDRLVSPLNTPSSIQDLTDNFNTPRNRRSDAQLTTQSNKLYDPDAENVQIITPNPTLEQTSATTKKYFVYTNPSHIASSFWTSTTTAPSTNSLDIEKIHLTTSDPYKHYYTNHRKYYRPAIKKKIHKPIRRISYEPALQRHEYYPMEVVGQYAGPYDEGPAVGLLQLFWSLVTSFAKPISRIVPQVTQIDAEARCFDLVACEAHRFGKLMGPTAEAIAMSFSTMISWVMPEPNKSNLRNAITSGGENTCWRQISACNERSGGKSLLTMVAQLLEMKTKNDSASDSRPNLQPDT